MKTEQIQFESEGQKIVGDLYNPDKDKVVLFIHGSSKKGREYGARKNYVERATAVANVGFTVLTFDMRGYGESEGDLDKFSIESHLNDSIAAFDLLKEKYPEVHIIGGSYGGYIGALLSEIRIPKSLVLKSPAIYEDKLFTQFGSYKVESLDFRNYGKFENTKAIKAISKYNGPFYMIGSERDECVPKRVLDSYFENAGTKNKTIDWIKEADHSLTAKKHKQEFIDLLVKWYSKIV